MIKKNIRLLSLIIFLGLIFFQSLHAQNIKICALRVSFEKDDDETTTGDGGFLMTPESEDTLCSVFHVDPPPHNNSYFQDHIKAVSNYYLKVSKGNLIIDTDQSEVYPRNDDNVFLVSQKMEYYNPFLEEDSVDIRLGELFIEAINLADEEVNFSDYDVVVLFHAGVGQDFAFDLDPTPYDIPSAYLNLNDLKLGSGNPNFTGISVDNGTKLITNGILLPESQNHILYENYEDVFYTDNPCDYQIGLNGTFAFMFGFYLGLPGLYDTETGETGIGKYGLMDQGSSNLNGMVPAVPNAWEREYLGWIDPVIANNDVIVNLSNAESNSDTVAWKIPIDDDEYFLIENRYGFINPGSSMDSIRNRLYDIRYKKDKNADYPSLFPFLKDSVLSEISNETGVLLSVPKYDIGLPGSGLLIWHIDESIIENNIDENRVNQDRENRGVDLEEGDGAHDIGLHLNEFFYESQHIGWGFDPWYAGNEGFWDLNQYNYDKDDEERVGFTGNTSPSTFSNNLVETGIRIDSIGHVGEIMNFQIVFENKEGNFPILLATENKNIHRPLVIDFTESDENNEILLFSDKIYLHDNNGNVLSSSDLLIDTANIDTTIALYDSNLLYIVNESVQDDVIYLSKYSITENGTIMFDDSSSYKNAGLSSNVLLSKDKLFFGINSSISWMIIYSFDNDEYTKYQVDPSITKIVGDDDYVYGFNGENNLAIYCDAESGVNNTHHAMEINGDEVVFGYINNNNHKDCISTNNEELKLILDFDEDDWEQLSVPIICNTVPVISDIDGDGKNEIIVGTENEIYVLNESLVYEENFPVSLPNLFSGKKFGEDILTSDINGDGILDIITVIENVGIIAFNKSGRVINGFPKATPTPESYSLSLFNSNNHATLAYLSSQNNELQLFGMKLSENPISENSWTSYGVDGNSFVYSYLPEIEPFISKDILDKGKTFCWPNPADGNTTNIRYFVNKECQIKVDIFDLAGDFVQSLSDDTPNIQDFDEIVWDVSNIQSGVYFAIVKAEKGGKTETKTIKIMVVK